MDKLNPFGQAIVDYFKDTCPQIYGSLCNGKGMLSYTCYHMIELHGYTVRHLPPESCPYWEGMQKHLVSMEENDESTN